METFLQEYHSVENGIGDIHFVEKCIGDILSVENDIGDKWCDRIAKIRGLVRMGKRGGGWQLKRKASLLKIIN